MITYQGLLGTVLQAVARTRPVLNIAIVGAVIEATDPVGVESWNCLTKMLVTDCGEEMELEEKVLTLPAVETLTWEPPLTA